MTAENTQLSPERLWKAQAQTWYPGLLEKTYCVPPVYFSRVPYKKGRVAELDVLVTEPPKEVLASQTAGFGGSDETALPVESGQPTPQHSDVDQTSLSDGTGHVRCQPESAQYESVCQTSLSESSGQTAQAESPVRLSNLTVFSSQANLAEDPMHTSHSGVAGETGLRGKSGQASQPSSKESSSEETGQKSQSGGPTQTSQSLLSGEASPFESSGHTTQQSCHKCESGESIKIFHSTDLIQTSPESGETSLSESSGQTTQLRESSQKCRSEDSTQPPQSAESGEKNLSGSSDQTTQRDVYSQRSTSEESSHEWRPRDSDQTSLCSESGGTVQRGSSGQTTQPQAELCDPNSQTKAAHSSSPPPSTSQHKGSIRRTRKRKHFTPKTKDENSSESKQKGCPSEFKYKSKQKDASELPKVQPSDIRDDFVQQHMLVCLQALGDSRRPQPMFIISNLKFRDFLVRASSPPPLPEGEFDIVLIGPSFGICVGEIKSVGLNTKSLSQSEAALLADIASKVEKGVQQLNKAKKTMDTMLKAVGQRPAVHTTLMLPCVTRDQLHKAVDLADPEGKLAKKLRQCLGAKDLLEASELCLCSDDVSDRSLPWHVPPAVLSKLEAWFLRRFGVTGQPKMSDDAYLDLVSSFCGPATAVYVHCPTPPRLEVRTVSQAVSLVGVRIAPEIGEKMAQIVLTPEQFDLLNAAPKRVWLTGPPGTGKTISVVLQGLVWLKQGFDVQIVSTRRRSLAVSHTIYRQLTRTLEGTGLPASPSRSVKQNTEQDLPASPSGSVEHEGETRRPCSVSSPRVEGNVRSSRPAGDAHYAEVAGRPYLRLFDFYNSDEGVDEALQELWALAGPTGKLHVIVDECIVPATAGRYQRFFKELAASLPDLHMWGTSVYTDELPEGVQQVKLTVPLRCPPIVMRQVRRGVDHYPTCDAYTDSPYPAPSDGPPVQWLSHSGTNHEGQWPVQCVQCGVDVAVKLRELGVGETGEAPLQYGDVVVLTNSSELRQSEGPSTVSEPQPSQNPNTPVCSFVRGLSSQGIPVHVLPCISAMEGFSVSKIVEDLDSTACGRVTVTEPAWVGGLERKVVVVLPGRDRDYPWSDAEWAQWDRLWSISRCTSQLVVVQCPGHPLQEL